MAYEELQGEINSSSGQYVKMASAGTASVLALTQSNVGIGTTEPPAKLTVASSANDSVNGIGKFTNSDLTSDGDCNFLLVGKDADTSKSALFGYRYHTNNDNAGAFVAVWGDNPAMQSLFVRKGGNIGVGTYEPAGKFDVAGSNSSQKILTLKENTASGQESFEVQSINGDIMVIPRERTSAGINAAIRYLQNSGDKGGKVFLPGGDPYDLLEAVNVGEYDGVTSGVLKSGSGIQIIGAGASKTILRIINTDENSISAIKINGGQDIDGKRGASVNVVIKDLEITLANDVTDIIHIGIENDYGCNVLVENVIIKGYSRYFDCGIKSTSWACLFHFCMIFGCWSKGIWLLESSNPQRAANLNRIVYCSIGIGVPSDIDTDVYGILVDDGAASQIIGCGFDSSCSTTGKIKIINVGSNSSQTSIMHNYFEGGDVGIKIEGKGNTVIGNFYSIGDEFVQIASGSEEGNIVMGSRNINTDTTDPAIFHSELADLNVLGNQSLENPSFSSSQYWASSQNISFDSVTARFNPDGSWGASLEQVQNEMDIPGVGNRWYKFEYTVVIPTGSINSGSNSLALAGAFDFQNGEGICVKGAGAGGADLITTIASGGGTTTLTLAASASTSVIFTEVQHSTTGTVDLSYPTTLNVANAIDFVNGQGICVQGAGAGGADLITTIASGGGTTTLTLATAASTTVTNGTVLHNALGYAACVTNLFAAGDTSLNLSKSGTHVLYLKSGANPGNFRIWAPPSSGRFTLDNLSLKEIQGGNIIAHGKVGIKTADPKGTLQLADRGSLDVSYPDEITLRYNHYYDSGDYEDKWLTSSGKAMAIVCCDNGIKIMGSNDSSTGAGDSVTGWNDLVRVQPGGNVGINCTSPNAAALLQMDSTTKGFLPPRMSNSQMYSISTPPEGLVIYNTNAQQLYYFNGSSWNAI